MNKFTYDKVLFVGSFAHGEFLEELLHKKAYTQFAANTVQKYYIDGILNELNLEVDVLSGLVTVPYPHNSEKHIRSDETAYGESKIVNVDFWNYPYLNQVSQGRKMRNFAKKWALENRDKKVLVVVYALRLVFLETAECIKRAHPNATVICIVPDLPQYMHTKSSYIRELINSVNGHLIDHARSCLDGYVLYTKKMAKALAIENKPWVVIEGLFDPEKMTKCSYAVTDTHRDKFVFMYGGGINEKYGLKMLVEGFLEAKMDDAELHIYGKGAFAEQLMEYEKENPSIRYFGAVAPDVMTAKMLGADVLVNPRPSSDAFTQYSCPSKVIEYMATGRAALITRLGGIPDEYYDYVYTIHEESVHGMAEAMKMVYSDSDENRIQKGARARDFIFSQKNLQQQMKKLGSLLEEIENNSYRV